MLARCILDDFDKMLLRNAKCFGNIDQFVHFVRFSFHKFCQVRVQQCEILLRNGCVPIVFSMDELGLRHN